MIFVLLPFLVLILATSVIFIIDEPTTIAYGVVLAIDFVMVFLMVKAYLTYIKVSHEQRDIEFAEEMTEMVKRVHDNREKFNREEIVMQLEHINRMINEYNLIHQDIIVEPVNIQDFLQRPSEKPH